MQSIEGKARQSKAMQGRAWKARAAPLKHHIEVKSKDEKDATFRKHAKQGTATQRNAMLHL
jgi:hypothetical protein